MPTDADDPTAGEHQGVVELRVTDLTLLRDRCVRPDIAVHDARVASDDRRAADPRTDDLCTGFDHHPSLDRRCRVDRAVDTRVESLEDQAVALQQRVLLTGVEPPPAQHLVPNDVATSDQPLNRIGDLELAARRGSDGPNRFVNAAIEEIHADQCKIRWRMTRLLDEPHYLPGVVHLRHAKLARVVDVREQDLRDRRVCSGSPARLFESFDEFGESLLEHVVTEVHDEFVVAEEVARDQHTMRQPERCLLGDERDANSPGSSRRRRLPRSRRVSRRR